MSASQKAAQKKKDQQNGICMNWFWQHVYIDGNILNVKHFYHW